jgi:hypothetical protein
LGHWMISDSQSAAINHVGLIDFKFILLFFILLSLKYLKVF